LGRIADHDRTAKKMRKSEKTRPAEPEKDKASRKIFGALILAVERIGNHLPHPFVLFIILIAAVLLLSFALSRIDVALTHITLDQESGNVRQEQVRVVNLLSKKMLQSVMENFVTTFAYFTPDGRYSDYGKNPGTLSGRI